MDVQKALVCCLAEAVCLVSVFLEARQSARNVAEPLYFRLNICVNFVTFESKLLFINLRSL